MSIPPEEWLAGWWLLLLVATYWKREDRWTINYQNDEYLSENENLSHKYCEEMIYLERTQSFLKNLHFLPFTKWSNTLKQFVSKLPTNCLRVFDHFVGLTLKGLIREFKWISFYSPKRLSKNWFSDDVRGNRT